MQMTECRTMSYLGRTIENELGHGRWVDEDDHLVESEYRSVCLKLFSRYAERAHQGATVAGDHLRGTAVVVENTCPFHKLELYEIGELPATGMLWSSSYRTF